MWRIYLDGLFLMIFSTNNFAILYIRIKMKVNFEMEKIWNTTLDIKMISAFKQFASFGLIIALKQFFSRSSRQNSRQKCYQNIDSPYEINYQVVYYVAWTILYCQIIEEHSHA